MGVNEENTLRISALAETCELGASCPLESVHARMRDTLRLWIECLKNYHEPEAFRTFLNSCIQALRNITFALQKNGDFIPDFAIWYDAWRQAMRSDPLLHWLVDARNRIVKEGDLATRSFARASLLHSYFEPPSMEKEVSPFLPLSKLALFLREQTPEEERERDGFLIVERRWMCDDLPDHELLEVLAHCFGRMACMLFGAHLRMREVPSGDLIAPETGFPSQFIAAEGRPPYMIRPGEYRQVRMRLSTGELIYFLRETRQFSEEEITVGGERYGQPPVIAQKKGESSVMRFARLILERAKQIILIDKELVPIAFLFLPDGSISHMELSFEDRSEKFLVWTLLANDVARLGATAVVAVGESWHAPFDPNHPARPAAESPDRRETIWVNGVSVEGDDFALVQFFLRKGNDIEFRELVEDTQGRSFFLDPIKRVWNESKSDS